MARLPDIDSLGARPVPVSRRGISSVRNAGAVGAAAGRVGETVSKIGERLDEIHDGDDVRRRDLEHAEQIRIIRDEARQAQGLNAKAAADQAKVKIEALNGKLLASARSKRSRTALEESLLRRSGNELSAIGEHARVETTRALEGSILARRDMLLEEAEGAWDRPEVLEPILAEAQSEIAAWGRSKGLSPEAVALEQRAARAKTRTSVAQRMITARDYDGALAYVEKYKDDIGHEAENALRATIQEPLDEETFDTIAAWAATADEGAAMPAAPAIAAESGNVVGRMYGITAIAESGNRERDSKGRLITSPAGAQGKMQVMPGTNTDPGFGVKPAQDDSDAERTRVGRDYLKAMMQRYGNDPAKAWAAYNWGPGNLDAAVKKHGAGWLSHAPAETRQYVNGNLARLGRKIVPAEAMTPTGRRVDYSASRARIEALDIPYYMKRGSIAALDRRMVAEDRVASRIEDDATKAALEVVEKLGDKFTNMSQIPANVLMRLPVQARISLAGQAAQNAAPKPLPANGEAALTLTLQSINDPEGFKKNDLRLYRGQVTAAEFEQLAVTQAKMRNEKPHVSPTVNLRSSINSTIGFYARDVGLDVSAKSEPEEREQYLRVFNGMERHILSITEGKRAPTDAELKAAFDRMTMEVTVKGGGWFGDSKKRVFEFEKPEGRNLSIEIPNSIKARIDGAYRASAGRAPSESELVSEYLRNKGRPGYWN